MNLQVIRDALRDVGDYYGFVRPAEDPEVVRHIGDSAMPDGVVAFNPPESPATFDGSQTEPAHTLDQEDGVEAVSVGFQAAEPVETARTEQPEPEAEPAKIDIPKAPDLPETVILLGEIANIKADHARLLANARSLESRVRIGGEILEGYQAYLSDLQAERARIAELMTGIAHRANGIFTTQYKPEGLDIEVLQTQGAMWDKQYLKYTATLAENVEPLEQAINSNLTATQETLILNQQMANVADYEELESLMGLRQAALAVDGQTMRDRNLRELLREDMKAKLAQINGLIEYGRESTLVPMREDLTGLLAEFNAYDAEDQRLALLLATATMSSFSLDPELMDKHMPQVRQEKGAYGNDDNVVPMYPPMTTGTPRPIPQRVRTDRLPN